MFAIYNIQGRAFRDSMEALKRVRQPHSAEKVDSEQGITQDETVVIQGVDSSVETDKIGSITDNQGIQAYRQMVHANEKTVIVHAHKIMTHPVSTLLSNISVKEAYEDFEKYGYNQFPVLAPQLDLIGMANRLQVTQAFHNNPQQKLSELMTEEIITADPISDVRRIAQVMHEYNLSAMPVVNAQDELVGLISKTDILKALITDPPLSLWA